MAATVQVQFYGTAPGTSGNNAETGIKFNRDASQTNTVAPIPRPTTTGTAYSWSKPLALTVTSADAGITISNRRISLASTISQTGLGMFFRSDSSYVAPAAVADAGTNVATPAGWTALNTSTQVYDAAGAAASAGRNGNWVSVLLGVGGNYAESGAGSNIGLPNIVFTWDEA